MIIKSNRKIILAIIFILILIVIGLLIGRFTYSYLGANIPDNLTGSGELTASGDTIIFSSDNKLSIMATTDNFNSASGNLSDTINPKVRLIASNKTNEATANYYVGIRIYNNTYKYSTSNETAEILLSVYDENGNIVQSGGDNLDYVTVNGVSGFDITGKTGVYNIAVEHPISTNSSTAGTIHTWTFTLTFMNLETDQSINENANLDMEVVLKQDEIGWPTLADVCNSCMTLNDCIKNYYTKYGEGIGGLYYHDGQGTYTNSDQEAGDNSYRYSGANPDNYVCFGSDLENCSNDNLYRIVGSFSEDGVYKVKLIKHDYVTNEMLGTGNRDYYGIYDYPTSYYKGELENNEIASYRWNNDTSFSDMGSNNWTTSELNTVNLNTNFINYLESINSKWSDMISETTWHLGSLNTWTYTTKEFYDNERGYNVTDGNPTEYFAKIGLMYSSDYGYAASPDAWATSLREYSNSSILENNWMYMGLYEWTITALLYSNYTVFHPDIHGFLSSSPAYYGLAIRPTFYLQPWVLYSNGDGTQENPYRVFLPENLISFTVDDVVYYAESGMTWEEWIDSNYNVDNFRLDGSSVCAGNALDDVNSTDIIEYGVGYISSKFMCTPLPT